MDENRGTIILGNLHINQEFIKLNEFHGAGSTTDAVLLAPRVRIRPTRSTNSVLQHGAKKRDVKDSEVDAMVLVQLLVPGTPVRVHRLQSWRKHVIRPHSHWIYYIVDLALSLFQIKNS